MSLIVYSLLCDFIYSFYWSFSSLSFHALISLFLLSYVFLFRLEVGLWGARPIQGLSQARCPDESTKRTLLLWPLQGQTWEGQVWCLNEHLEGVKGTIVFSYQSYGYQVISCIILINMLNMSQHVMQDILIPNFLFLSSHPWFSPWSPPPLEARRVGVWVHRPNLFIYLFKYLYFLRQDSPPWLPWNYSLYQA